MGKPRLSYRLPFLPVKAASAFGWVFAFFLLFSPLAAHAGDPAEGLEMTDYYEAGSESTSGVSDLEFINDYTCNNGTASGSIYRSTRCQTAQGFSGIFSNVICRIESILGQSIGELYCAVSYRAEKPFLALLILYVTIYGAMVILGMHQAKLPEALMHVFKVGVVSIFILNAPLALGIGYKFYIGTAQTATGLAFNAFEDQAAQQAFASDLQQIDPIRANESRDAGYIESTDGGSAAYQNQGATQWVDNADRMFFKLIIYILRAMSAVMILIVILFFVSPGLFFLLATFFIKIFQALFQIIVGYILALIGLTFLFSLAPVIVPLWLFRFSQRICMTWLKYLASYAIQIAICMVFIALFTKVDFVTQMERLGVLGRQKDIHLDFGWWQWRFMQWTLCRVERTEDGGYDGDILYYKYDALNNATEQAQAWNGYPRCIPEYTFQQAMSGERLPPTISADEIAELKALRNEGDGDAEDVEKSIKKAIEKANDDNILDFWDVLADGELLFFFAMRLISSISLAIVMTLYLKKVPAAAERIAQTIGSGQLGGGEVEPGSPPSIQASVNPSDENDPFHLQQYAQRTRDKVKESRAQFRSTRGRFFSLRNTSSLAGNLAMTPLALLGVGARRHGGYFRNLGGRLRGIGTSGYNVGFATAYHSFAGANALRTSVTRRLANPRIHTRLAYNAKARQQMMDDIERRELLWEGEQLARNREDTRYDEFGNRLREARRRGRINRIQQRQRAQSNAGGGGRPSRVDRPSPTNRSTNPRNSGGS